MHLVCCCRLPVWRRSFLKKGTPLTYFGPALDPPLGGSGRKTTTLVRDLEYFVHTKFHQNPSSCSGEEVENVNCLKDERRTTDAGQRVITIGHLSLRLPTKGAFSSNVWNWNFKLSKNQLNHSILFYLCAERRTSRECVCLMAARHRYLFLRYTLLNQTTLNMQNNRYVTWYTFTFPLIR